MSDATNKKSDGLNKKSEVFFVGFFVGWMLGLGVGWMALLLRDWTPYYAVGLSVAYMVLGVFVGCYAFKSDFAFALRRIRELLGRSGAD